MFENKIIKLLGLCFISSFLIIACGKKKTNDNTSTFEKATLLENVATNLIIPEYEQFSLKLSDFQTKYNTFVTSQTTENFTTVQEAWKDTYVQWQNILMYELGPSMEKLLQSSIGTFPTDTNKVLSNIAAQSYDLSQVSNFTAQGLPVFDFLLYRENAMSYFQDAKYAAYGNALIQKLITEFSSALNTWKTSYKTTFIASTGTESTSAFSSLVNEYIKAYEQTKWAKLGIPLGKQSLDVKQPKYIEAKASGIALKLLLENIKANKRIFNGDQANGSKGIGFDDYLIAVNKSDLVNTINNEYDDIITSIQAINSTFEYELTNNPKSLEDIYDKIYNLTIHLKTDMTAAFGVMITYQDNDGD